MLLCIAQLTHICFITFEQNPGPAVIVAETVLYQIIQEISQARGKNTVCSRDCLR